MAAASPVHSTAPVVEANNLSYRYDNSASVNPDVRGPRKAPSDEPQLIEVTCSFQRGSRVLVVGANGAGKSTLLSIMGGKKLVLPSSACRILGKQAFDASLDRDRMYCGDWWRSDFFFNITVAELIGEVLLATERVQTLIDVMQINISWRINVISDGQRRRCQLLECLAVEKSVYVLDEITTDLDLFAREGLLRFLRQESEQRGATIFYATHIFDHLAEWGTHILSISQARVTHCCSMEELSEYHALVAQGTRCPLYTLMRTWVSSQYDEPMLLADDSSMAITIAGPALEVKCLNYAYDDGKPQLKDVSFSFPQGARIIVVGANGAGKSTLLSILGGKRMIRRGMATILGSDCFNDPAVSPHVMYVGDWWRTSLLMNPSIAFLLGDAQKTPRCQNLIGILRVDVDWRINELSDGQRRRCQLLEILSVPRSVYLMDEITSDLDVVVREGVLAFLRAECESRGATVVYCSHIFDHLEGWATHLLHLSEGSVVRACGLDEIEDYNKLIVDGNPTPLYSLVRQWIYAEYDASRANATDGVESWRKLDTSLDGRRPNLGLAGPMQTHSG